MSGLIALFDDVAAIAKLAATSIDDVVAQAAKAGTKRKRPGLEGSRLAKRLVF